MSPLLLRKCSLFSVTPILQSLFECNGILDPLELGNAGEAKWAAIIGVANGIGAIMMLGYASLNVVRNTDIERSIKASQHIDVIESHALHLRLRGKSTRRSLSLVVRLRRFAPTLTMTRCYARDDKALGMTTLGGYGGSFAPGVTAQFPCGERGAGAPCDDPGDRNAVQTEV